MDEDQEFGQTYRSNGGFLQRALYKSERFKRVSTGTVFIIRGYWLNNAGEHIVAYEIDREKDGKRIQRSRRGIEKAIIAGIIEILAE